MDKIARSHDRKYSWYEFARSEHKYLWVLIVSMDRRSRQILILESYGSTNAHLAVNTVIQGYTRNPQLILGEVRLARSSCCLI